jgi:hypothetical protein
MLELSGSGRQFEKNGRLQHDLLAVISFHSRVMMLLPTGDSDWQRSNGRFYAMLGGEPEIELAPIQPLAHVLLKGTACEVEVFRRRLACLHLLATALHLCTINYKVFRDVR